MEVSNAKIFHTSVNVDLNENGDPTPTFSKLIGRELSHNSSADIYSRYQVNFTHNAVGTKIPNFINLGIPAVHTPDELGSFSTPATRFGRPTYGSNWSTLGHVLGVSKAVGVSGRMS